MSTYLEEITKHHERIGQIQKEIAELQKEREVLKIKIAQCLAKEKEARK